jgi:hypothetical protein
MPRSTPPSIPKKLDFHGTDPGVADSGEMLPSP